METDNNARRVHRHVAAAAAAKYPATGDWTGGCGKEANVTCGGWDAPLISIFDTRTTKGCSELNNRREMGEGCGRATPFRGDARIG